MTDSLWWIDPGQAIQGETVDSLICKSAAMREVARRIERAAQADSPVLIWGEPGSGKKLVAKTIHRQSRRADAPLVIVAASENGRETVEVELFGAGGQPGRLAAVAGGTLLVEEIAGLRRTTQAKLLEAAERRAFEELRDSDGQPLDFRLMATTEHELAESVRRGALREDLYYRLTVVTIRVPPLRERPEDIPPLVRQMLVEICAARGRPVPALDPELVRYLVDRPWPGNCRELRELLDATLVEGETDLLGMKHLPPSLIGPARRRKPAAREARVDTLADLEREAVMRALKVHQGNRTQAARALGISVRTLQRKLRHWDG